MAELAPSGRPRELLGETSSTGGWLTPTQAGDVLRGYGIESLGETVTGVDAAAAAADGLGFPVALKVADPEVVHKTDRGLVRVGLRDEAEVRDRGLRLRAPSWGAPRWCWSSRWPPVSRSPSGWSATLLSARW